MHLHPLRDAPFLYQQHYECRRTSHHQYNLHLIHNSHIIAFLIYLHLSRDAESRKR